MNKEINELESLEKAVDYFNPSDHNITVTRSIVNKGKIAPTGFAFYEARYKDKGKRSKIYTMTLKVGIVGMTDEQEIKLKSGLAKKLKEHFNL